VVNLQNFLLSFRAHLVVAKNGIFAHAGGKFRIPEVWILETRVVGFHAVYDIAPTPAINNIKHRSMLFNILVSKEPKVHTSDEKIQGISWQ
jgi:hypothetical protein